MFWAARALHWWSQRVYNLVRKDQGDHLLFSCPLRGLVISVINFSFGRQLGSGPSSRGNLVKLHRAGDRSLQLLIFNEEFLVSASHQLALITSLPFVHTARRYYRLNGLVRSLDWRNTAVWQQWCVGKLIKLDHLEEVKVVTRFLIEIFFLQVHPNREAFAGRKAEWRD